MLKSKPSKTVERLVRAHVMKLPHRVSKDFKAGMRAAFWLQIRDYAFVPDYKPGTAKFDAFRAGYLHAQSSNKGAP